MLFLFETAAGYALFKVVKESKLEKAEVRALRRPLDRYSVALCLDTPPATR